MKAHRLDISTCANAHAATYDVDRAAGFVNAWRNSFPAEDVPFGGTLLVAGIPFSLPRKIAGAPDHIEAEGQDLDVGAALTARAVGVLGFGELGDQRLGLTLTNRFGETRRAEAVLPNWLVPASAPATAGSWRASHLHYAAGYELGHLRPTLFGVMLRLPAAFQPLRVTLDANPLAHVMAISLLLGESDHG